MILLKLHSDYVTGNDGHWLIVYLNANTLTTKTESQNKSLYFNNHTDTALPLLTLIDIYWSTSSPTLSEYNISLIDSVSSKWDTSYLLFIFAVALMLLASPISSPTDRAYSSWASWGDTGGWERWGRSTYVLSEGLSPSLARIRSRSRIMNSLLRPFNLSVYSWVTDSKHIIPR